MVVIILKSYLEKRECQSSYAGGISSFLLFYMVLAYFQNYSGKYTEKVPDIFKFIEFYSTLNESKYGLQIDLSEIFPEDGVYAKFKEFPKIVEINKQIHRNVNFETDEPLLYIKDPIGKIYYSDYSD